MSTSPILVTGRHLTGKGHRAAEAVMYEMIERAQSDVIIAAYVITESMTPLLEAVERGLQRGVRATVIVNHSDDVSARVRARLESMGRCYKHARIAWFSDPEGSQLHAKVVVADRQRAIVGSANFTRGGMLLNHEIGMLVEGQAAWELADLIEDLVLRMTGA